MRQLTKLQRNVLAFIEGYRQGCGETPTIYEIQTGLEIKHKNTVQGALRGLEKKRYIRRWPVRQARNIILQRGLDTIPGH